MFKSTRLLLINELTHRQNRNAAYSLRAFARDLGVSVTALSDFLGKKRNLSSKNLEKIIESLNLSPLETNNLKSDLKQLRSEKKIEKEQSEERLLLEEDQFRLVADWHYLAILNLVKLKSHRGDPKWIAERLGLEASIVEQSLDRLLRMKLIRKDKNKFVRISRPLITTRDVPSAAIRRYHVQNLLRAEKSLHKDSVKCREFGAVTMTVNMEKLQKAKDIIFKTIKRIAAVVEDAEATEVYTLSFQLFPVTKIANQNSGEDFQ